MELTLIGLMIAVIVLGVVSAVVLLLSAVGSVLFTLFEWLADAVVSIWRKRGGGSLVVSVEAVPFDLERVEPVAPVELAPTYTEPVARKPPSKALSAPIAADIGSRASGSYALWLLLVQSDFLGGKWGETDWATCVVGVKGGVPSRIELPIRTREGYEGMLLKYDLGVSMTVLLSELTAAYENRMFHHVHDVASRCFGSEVLTDHNNYFEWFVRASSTKDLSPASEAKKRSLSATVAHTKGSLLAERNFELVHRVYVAATRLTLTE